jgi:hypothetical protein
MYYFIEERLIFQILPYFNHVNYVGVFKADFTKFIIDACISYAGLIIPEYQTKSFENLLRSLSQDSMPSRLCLWRNDRESFPYKSIH